MTIEKEGAIAQVEGATVEKESRSVEKEGATATVVSDGRHDREARKEQRT